MTTKFEEKMDQFYSNWKAEVVRHYERIYETTYQYRKDNDISHAEYELASKLSWYPEDFYKILNREFDKKRATLFSNILKKGIKIEDITECNLEEGHDGTINGTITDGETVIIINTIYAGGYNIQKLHYRVLVKVAKAVKA